MWQQKINVAPAKISLSAFSLIEVLMASALGAFLLLLVASSYANFYYTQTKQKEQLYLQAEAHQLLNYFQQHFQHIGYQGSHRTGSNFDLFQHAGKSLNILHKNCIIGFYDLNQDGCLGKRRTKTTACKLGTVNNTREVLKEIVSFKLENNEIYTFSSQLDNCIKEQCQTLLKTCDGNWSKFTDVHNFKTKKLDFSWKQEDNLLKIELEIESAKQKGLIYTAVRYVFILNH